MSRFRVPMLSLGVSGAVYTRWFEAPMRAADADPASFSLVRGGPVYRRLCALRLVRSDRRDVLRLWLAVLAATWLPIVVLDLLQHGMHWSESGMLRAVSLHARFLLAVPLLLL